MIFRGTIIELRDSGKGVNNAGGWYRDTGKIAVFRVTRVWKGDVEETFEMPAIEETSTCMGFWPSHLKVGNDLLVYASRFSKSGPYVTDICTRTALAKDAKDFGELGPGSEPKKPSESKEQKQK